MSKYQKAINEADPNYIHPKKASIFPTSNHKYDVKQYEKWMYYLFQIEKVMVCPMKFKELGVGITTNTVCASVLFLSTLVPPVPNEDES